MVLKVEIVSSPQGVVIPEALKTISEQGGSLGRGENNTWVLEDPERFISSRHCEFSCEGGQYYLTDHSTNGTFVNGSPEPLGRSNRVLLNDGDSIEMGEYKFSVHYEQAPEQDISASLDPFASPVSPFDEAPMELGSGSGASLAALGGGDYEPVSGDISAAETDPLAALDKAAADPFSAPVGELDPNLNPNQNNPGKEAFPYGQNSYSDNLDPLGGAFDMPPASGGEGGLIPEDWEEGLDSNEVPQESGRIRESAKSAEREHVRRPRPASRSESRASMGSVQPSSRSRATKNSDSDSSGVHKRVETPRPAATHSSSDAGCADMLAAMGLDTGEISAQSQREIALAIGELMPVVVEGMMRVLRSRASIKNEFRMNITTIQPIENNPLKFSADTQEAMENMFTRNSKAYKGPVDAFDEGFTAISEHQIAIVAGIRAAFSRMIEHFDPSKLERQFEKQAKGGVSIPGMQKARYWGSYTEYYQSFIDNMEQSFQNLFGDEFVRAYEDQLFKLMSARSKDKK